MNSGLSIGVHRQKFYMSMMKYFAPGVDSTEFHNILIVGRSAVGLLASMRHTILSPPTVRRDLCFSILSGLYATTMRPYVTSFLLSAGMSDFMMKVMVLVPGMSRIPCARRPSLLAREVDHRSRSSGLLMRSLYSSFSPVFCL